MSDKSDGLASAVRGQSGPARTRCSRVAGGMSEKNPAVPKGLAKTKRGSKKSQKQTKGYHTVFRVLLDADADAGFV